MDVLYISRSKSEWIDNQDTHLELKYSIRSLEKHYKNLGKLYLVGYKPNWMNDNVVFIEKEETTNHIPTNIIGKIIEGCKQEGISKEFLFCADDYFFLKNVTDEVLNIVHTHGDYQNFRNYNNGHYAQVLRNTIDYLKSKKLTAFNCEAHTPYVLDKDLFPSIMEQHPYKEGLGFTSTTVYFNVKGNNNYLLTKKSPYMSYINARTNEMSLYRKVFGRTFLCINGQAGPSEVFKKFISQRYINKSSFEK